MSNESLLQVTVEEGIATLVLDRPEKLNALNQALVQALSDALRELAAREDLRALILTGAGSKAFVAGADIPELLERGAEEALQGINATLFREVEEFPWPVIAAIGGWAIGGGLELALACDIRIASEKARFRQPEMALGILPAAGGLHRLPTIVGMGNAKDLVLTGRTVHAEEALSMGLVSRVVPAERLMEEARKAAKDAAGMAGAASRLAKRLMNSLSPVRPDLAFALESSAQGILFESEEKKRRMGDFVEKSRKRQAEKEGSEG